MPPRPDPSGKREQGQTVLQFETPFGGFVAEQFHSDNSSRPTAKRTQQCQGRLRYAAARFRRSPLVDTERSEGTDVHGDKPDDAKSSKCIQACQVLSRAGSVGAKNSSVWTIQVQLSWLPRLVLLQVLAHCQVSGFRDRPDPDYTTRQMEMVAREGAAPPIAGCRPAVILFHHRAVEARPAKIWLPELGLHEHSRLQRAVSY